MSISRLARVAATAGALLLALISPTRAIEQGYTVFKSSIVVRGTITADGVLSVTDPAGASFEVDPAGLPYAILQSNSFTASEGGWKMKDASGNTVVFINQAPQLTGVFQIQKASDSVVGLKTRYQIDAAGKQQFKDASGTTMVQFDPVGNSSFTIPAYFASTTTLSGGFKVRKITPTSGQVLTFDGANWAPAAASGGGGVTVYPATATASFPLGFSVSTINVVGAWSIFRNGQESRLDCSAGQQFVFNANSASGEAIFAPNYGSSGTHRFADSGGYPFYRMLTGGGSEMIRIGTIGSIYAAIQSMFSGPVTVLPASNSNVVFAVQGVTSQSGNLQEWRDPVGTPILSVNSSGYIGNGAAAAGAAYPLDLRAKAGSIYGRFGINFAFSDSPEASYIGRGAFGRDDGSEVGFYNYNGGFSAYTAANNVPALRMNIDQDGKTTFYRNALGLSFDPSDGVSIINATPATNVDQYQTSPGFKISGQAWNSSSSASNQIDFRQFVFANAGAAPLGILDFQSQINGGGYTTLMDLRTSGGPTFYAPAGGGGTISMGLGVNSSLQLNSGSGGSSEAIVFSHNGVQEGTFQMASGIMTFQGASGVTQRFMTNGTADAMSADLTGSVGFNKISGIGAQVHIVPHSSSTVGQITQGATSQSANLSEWQDVAGATGTIVTSDLAIVPFQKTKAQLQAFAPAKAGEMFYCSDCTVDGVVISTGTGVGAFARISARTTGIQ